MNTRNRSYGFTFISISGVNLEKVQTNVHKTILDLQKENSLEILSEFCSGNFTQSFHLIAQQQKVIEKFKASFTNLAHLMTVKAALIKPIFLAICSKNDEMADWIIDKFLDKEAKDE